MATTTPAPPLGVREAAAILRLSPRAVQRLLASGDLPAHKLSGKTGSYVIALEDVEKLLAERTAA